MYSQVFSLQEEVFKVMANQKRLEILLLLRQGELRVSDMIDMLDIRQANLSQNLALVREHGLVNVRRQGREMYYSLADPAIAESIDAVAKFLQRKHALTIDADQTPFPFVTDPICGMRFSKSEAFDSFTDKEKTYYFCASGCVAKFIENLSMPTLK